MRAQPCYLMRGQGYLPCATEHATHLKIHIPGPTGELTLPIQTRGARKDTGNWTWNASTTAPTLRPSVLTQGTTFLGGEATDKANWVPFRCHVWVTDGAAQYLDDTDHALRGQTVDLIDL
jgi:uncharacterized protein DUF6527